MKNQDCVSTWMPLYIGAYLGKTMHLTTEQHGAYLLLMIAYWKNQGPLSASKAPAICRMDPDAWSIHQAVLEEFFDTDTEPGKWIHPRIEEELSKAREARQKTRERATKAACSRWAGRKKDAPSIA